MTITVPSLLVCEEAVRMDEIELVFGSRHSHVEQASLLFDLFGRRYCHVRWDAAIHDIQNKVNVAYNQEQNRTGSYGENASLSRCWIYSHNQCDVSV